MVKGEDAAVPLLVARRGSSAGTINPTTNKDRRLFVSWGSYRHSLENRHSDEDSLGGFWDVTARILSLGCGDSQGLNA